VSLILTVDERAWRAHVDRVWAEHPGLVPVVKGTGYGFGREVLAAEAAGRGARFVAVGTVHELDGLPPGPTPVVLTPTTRVAPDAAIGAVLTIADPAQLAAAAVGGAVGVIVEVTSSMRRYGTDAGGVRTLVDQADAAGLVVVAAGIHLPLAGSSAERAAETAAWCDVLPAGLPLWVSHLDAGDVAALAARGPGRTVVQRIGTRLWLGDKGFTHLGAEVVSLRDVAAGDRCGYRQVPAPAGGTVVTVGAGTVQGVRLLDDTRSPIHHARRRLALIEPPHQHATLAFVPEGEPCPQLGDVVDVQRPLTEVRPDELVWR
jgi:hypothetical protein